MIGYLARELRVAALTAVATYFQRDAATLSGRLLKSKAGCFFAGIKYVDASTQALPLLI